MQIIFLIFFTLFSLPYSSFSMPFSLYLAFFLSLYVSLISMSRSIFSISSVMQYIPICLSCFLFLFLTICSIILSVPFLSLFLSFSLPLLFVLFRDSFSFLRVFLCWMFDYLSEVMAVCDTGFFLLTNERAFGVVIWRNIFTWVCQGKVSGVAYKFVLFCWTTTNLNIVI